MSHPSPSPISASMAQGDYDFEPCLGRSLAFGKMRAPKILRTELMYRVAQGGGNPCWQAAEQRAPIAKQDHLPAASSILNQSQLYGSETCASPECPCDRHPDQHTDGKTAAGSAEYPHELDVGCAGRGERRG